MDELGKDRAKKLAKLATVKGRREQGMILLDSIPVVGRALELGLPSEVFYDPRRGEEVEALASRAGEAGITLTPARPETLSKLCGVTTSPGIAAVAPRREAPDLKELMKRDELRCVFAEELTDPGNVGTIARTASAFGVDVLIVSRGSADPEAPKTLRASAGSLLNLPVLRAELHELEALCAEAQLIRTVVTQGLAPDQLPGFRKWVLWLGNESRGVGEVPEGWRSVDVTIPMQSGTESLNVASAAAILLHALRKT